MLLQNDNKENHNDVLINISNESKKTTIRDIKYTQQKKTRHIQSIKQDQQRYYDHERSSSNATYLNLRDDRRFLCIYIVQH